MTIAKGRIPIIYLFLSRLTSTFGSDFLTPSGTMVAYFVPKLAPLLVHFIRVSLFAFCLSFFIVSSALRDNKLVSSLASFFLPLLVSSVVLRRVLFGARFVFINYLPTIGLRV